MFLNALQHHLDMIHTDLAPSANPLQTNILPVATTTGLIVGATNKKEDAVAFGSFPMFAGRTVQVS